MICTGGECVVCGTKEADGKLGGGFLYLIVLLMRGHRQLFFPHHPWRERAILICVITLANQRLSEISSSSRQILGISRFPIIVFFVTLERCRSRNNIKLADCVTGLPHDQYFGYQVRRGKSLT